MPRSTRVSRAHPCRRLNDFGLGANGSIGRCCLDSLSRLVHQREDAIFTIFRMLAYVVRYGRMLRRMRVLLVTDNLPNEARAGLASEGSVGIGCWPRLS